MPPDSRNERILINVGGTLAPRANAVVSVFDSGFMLGDGVWEEIRVHKVRASAPEQLTGKARRIADA